MSEGTSAPSAPAAAPATSSPQTNGPPKGQVEAAKPQKLKIAEYEFNNEAEAKAEIERGRQSGKILTEAQKRLFESQKRDKAWDEIKGEVKTKKDAKRVISELGLSKEEAVEVFGKWLYENEVLPREMSPEQRRIKELEAQAAKYKEEQESQARTQKEKEHEAATVKEAQKLRQELEAVLNAKKVPSTRLALRRVANYLASYSEAGADIPVERAADLVMEDYKQEFGELFDETTPEALEAFFGKARWQQLAKKVSQWAMNRARAGQPPPPPEPVMRTPKAEKSDKITPQEFQKMMRGLK